METERFKRAKHIFRSRGGVMRMAEALRAGVGQATLYAMHDKGVLERLSRGLYRLVSLPAMEAPDLVTVTARVPRGVICLISALAYHELTTQVPHRVDIAIARGSEPPRVNYPPIQVYWFSGDAFTTGIKTPVIDEQRIRVYSAEKTIADAFKDRNKIGLDVAIESLRMWRERQGSRFAKILEHARTCRVERVIMPYLEAIA